MEVATDTSVRRERKRFIIEGKRSLSGTYPVQGNKNAALPLICAALLADRPVLLNNTPRILDVQNLVLLLEGIGVKAEWSTEGLRLDGTRLNSCRLSDELVGQLRGAVLVLGAICSRFDEIRCALPGGCPIGRRSFNTHWAVFRAAGFEVEESVDSIRIKRVREVGEPVVYLDEASVTATENALLLFSALGGGIIQNPAREPHVFNLIAFLQNLGGQVELHPLYFRVHGGVRPQRRRPRQGEVSFDVQADFIDAGTIAVASATCGGTVLLEGISREAMLGIEPVLSSFGVHFDWTGPGSAYVRGEDCPNPSKITAGPWPLFPTDLVSLAIVLASQRQGLCLIHDWMYEGRMFFVDKLIRMGAGITMCDPHRVLVEGPRSLRGQRLESPDIRAGMSLVVAGLSASGTTQIELAHVIERGYENIVSRLQGIGAEIREC